MVNFKAKQSVGRTNMQAMTVVAIAAALVSPNCVQAVPAKAGLEVVVLGSGGPRAFGRAGSSYVVVVDGMPRILVDAGPGAFVRMGELELDLEPTTTRTSQRPIKSLTAS